MDFLGDQLIGTLFISLQGDEANIRSSIAYLNGHNVAVEEIQQGKKQNESEAEAVWQHGLHTHFQTSFTSVGADQMAGKPPSFKPFIWPFGPLSSAVS